MLEPETSPAATAESDTTRGPSTASFGPPDPQASPDPTLPVPAIGQELGPVQLVSELGRGAAGIVYLGHHKLLGRNVAVKCLVGGAGFWGEGGSRRFVEEARAAAAVQHANLTQIYHADIVRDMPFLVMEYVDGPTLGGLLGYAGRMSPALARGVMSEVAAAVAELHDRGLIHRDLKPSNVLIDRQGRVRVSDFGLAMRRATFASVSTASPEVAGTPAYMAPEMFEGRVSPRSDIYAMGVMMSQLLTGKPPFRGSFEEIIAEHRSKPLPLKELRGAGVDDALIDLLERATHKQFLYRHKTAHELRRALAALGVDAADCRRELAGLILSMHARSAPGTSAAPATAAAADAESSYAQTIARLATTKRERRSTAAITPPLPAPPPLAMPIAAIPVAALPLEMPAPIGATAVPQPADVRIADALRKEYFVPTPERPGILTALSVIGIVAATLGLGLLVIDASMLPGIQPRPSDPLGGLRPWAMVLTAINAILIALLFTGSVAAFRLKRRARPMLLAYAGAELLWQLIAVGIGLYVAVPRVLEATLATSKFASPQEADQVMHSFKIILEIFLVLRCVLGCAFAIATVIVLRRPLVRLALGARHE